MKPWIKVKPRYDWSLYPSQSAKVSFVNINSVDWKLPGNNQSLLTSVFSLSSYILVLRYQIYKTIFLKWCSQELLHKKGRCCHACSQTFLCRLRTRNLHVSPPPSKLLHCCSTTILHPDWKQFLRYFLHFSSFAHEVFAQRAITDASKVVEQQSSWNISNFPFWCSKNQTTNSITKERFSDWKLNICDVTLEQSQQRV